MVQVVKADAITRGVDEGVSNGGVSVTIRIGSIGSISGRDGKVGGIGLRVSTTFGISVVGSAGDGLVGSVHTGGRFAQVGVDVGVAVVAGVSQEVLRVSLGFGESRGNKSENDLK